MENGIETLKDFRKRVRRSSSVLGWAMAFMFGMNLALQHGFLFLEDWLSVNAAGGAAKAVYQIISGNWFHTSGMILVSYVLILPPTFLIMSRVPEERREEQEISWTQWLLLLVLAHGMGILLNLAGNLVNFWAAAMTGRNPADLNPVAGLQSSMDFGTILYVTILGPVLEEYIFRKKLLCRLRPFGDRAAILYSSLAFGLYHGNLTQFLYAAFIGTILAYLAVRTGRLLSGILLHMAINSYSVTLILAASSGTTAGLLWLGLSVILSFAAVVAAVVILVLRAGKIRLEQGQVPEGIRFSDYAGALFLNSGTLAFCAAAAAVGSFYLFFA